MKKTLFCLFIALVCLLTVAGCTGGEREDTAKSGYEIEFSLEENTLNCRQTVDFVNVYSDGLREIKFNLYMNAYAEDAVDKAYATPLKTYGGTEITALKINGNDASFTLSENKLSFSVPVDSLKLGDRAEIYMEYTVTLPECDLRTGYSDGYYNLSNFYPQIAVYGEEGFLSDAYSAVGDPILSDVADFSVKATFDEHLVAATPALGTETIAEGKKTISIRAENIRDFAMVLSDKFLCETVSDENLTVYYFHEGNEESAERASLALDVLKTFSSVFGDYPYDTFTVASTPFAEEGMEFSGLVYIDNLTTDFEKTLIHETAHQWWYNLVGNDNVREGWLDEGLTTFSTAYYYSLKGDEETFAEEIKSIRRSYALYERSQKLRGDKGALNINVDIYSCTDYQYGMLAYNKSCLLFADLYEKAGKEKFEKALSSYVDDNRFRRADSTSLADAFGKAMNCDVTGIIDGWLSDKAVVTTFA